MISLENKYIFPETSLFYTHSDKGMKKDRKTYIGGSDSEAFGSLMKGLPYLWTTPFIVWIKKKQYHFNMIGNEFSDASITAMDNGISAEARLRNNTPEYLENIYKKKFEVFKSPATYRMKAYPYVGANIDGILKDIYGNYSGLEIKTTSYKKAWLENKYSGVPFGYFCQVQHYMMVLGLPRFYIVCEYKTKNYKGDIVETGVITRVVEADLEFQKDLLDSYKDFWENNILKDIPPKLGGIEKEEIYFPCLPENYLKKDLNQINKIEKYLVNKEIIKDLDKANENLKDEIIEILGEGFFIMGGYRIKSQTISTRRFASQKFRDDYPELSKEYTCIQTNYKSLQIYKLKKGV